MTPINYRSEKPFKFSCGSCYLVFSVWQEVALGQSGAGANPVEADAFSPRAPNSSSSRGLIFPPAVMNAVLVTKEKKEKRETSVNSESKGPRSKNGESQKEKKLRMGN